MKRADPGPTPDAVHNSPKMRCLRPFTIRRYRLRYTLLLGLPILILIILLKTNIFIHRKESTSPRKHLHHGAGDGEVSVLAKKGRSDQVELGGRFQPPPGDWRKWKESKESGVNIHTWTAKKSKKVVDEIVQPLPGEQILLDDVVPEAFQPFLLPTTTIAMQPRRKVAPVRPLEEPNGKVPRNEIFRQNREDDREIVKLKQHVGRGKLEVVQGGFDTGRQIARESVKRFDSERDSNAGESDLAHGDWNGKMPKNIHNNRMEGIHSDVIRQVDTVNLGRGDHGMIGKAKTRAIKSGSRNIEQNLETISQEGNKKMSNANDLMDNSNVMDLNIDDIKALRKMHTPPSWTHTLKPLRYADYTKNCTLGSLPLPGSSFHTKKFCLVEDLHEHFGMTANRLCYHKGTDVEKTKRLDSDLYCHCRKGWHGKWCSMPDIVFNGGYPYEYGVRIQETPRRLIYTFPFNAEFDMLDIILNSLSEAVDVFLILESNYTAAGQPKDRVLLQRLQNNYFKEFQHKIVYISLDYFPHVAYTDGWAADALLRNYIGETAFGGLLENVRDDDIIVSLDTDEIIHPEALLFLKLHYGYPEPFGFVLRHTVYGYFWRAPDEVTNTYGGCRVAMFRDLLKGHLYDVRNAPKNIGRDAKKLKKFKRHHGTRIKPWLFGSNDLPAGWHCSWCFPPLGIRYKLISAHASDFPRWGTFPDKTNVVFIMQLVKQGLWFDEKTFLKRQIPGDGNYAPPYVEAHTDRFASLREYEAYMKNNQKLLILNKGN